MFRIKISPIFTGEYHDISFTCEHSFTIYILKRSNKRIYKVFDIEEDINMESPGGLWEEIEVKRAFEKGEWIKINNYEKGNSRENPDINAGI